MSEDQIAKAILTTVIGLSSIIALIATSKWSEYKKRYHKCYNDNKYLLRELKAQSEAGKLVMKVVHEVAGRPMKAHYSAFSISRQQVYNLISASDRMMDPDWYARNYE